MITAAKVVNASRIELLCLTYEIFLEDIEEVLSLEDRERKKRIDHAREILVQLVEGLDFSVTIATDLFRLYSYMQNALINDWQDNEKMLEVQKLMTIIYEGYVQILEQECEKRPLMQNAENVYAGMTYGKGYLNEVVMGNEQRGFKA